MYGALHEMDRSDSSISIGIAKLVASKNAIEAAIDAVGAMGARGNETAVGMVDRLQDVLMTSAPSGTPEVILKRVGDFVVKNHSVDSIATVNSVK